MFHEFAIQSKMPKYTGITRIRKKQNRKFWRLRGRNKKKHLHSSVKSQMSNTDKGKIIAWKTGDLTLSNREIAKNRT